MIYLSGHVSPRILADPAIGVLLTPRSGYRPALRGQIWAADNACFTQPEAFTMPRYLAWLGSWRECADTCLFATAPDVVADARATWERSSPALPLIRAAGYRAALVAQDGIEDLQVEWSAFDALFVGGTTRWKLSEPAYALMRAARERGKWVHVGRVNSARRLRAAEIGGADSVDGTFLRYAPDHNLARMRRWSLQANLWPTAS